MCVRLLGERRGQSGVSSQVLICFLKSFWELQIPVDDNMGGTPMRRMRYR